MEPIVSPYLIVPIIAWLIAQLSKYALQSFKKGATRNYNVLYKSGDMPSSHAAVMMSLLMVVALKDGPQTSLFGVVAVITAVVLYDAVNVRRAVGEQGKALKALVTANKQQLSFYTAKGHTVAEVIVGSLLGIGIALVMLQFL
jgi:acid phosphatase family membrane protein YuiD